jgi:hypothetical protein
VCFSEDSAGADPRSLLHRGWAHPRMWAQYAGDHTGVCLFFDKRALERQMRAVLTEHGTYYGGPVIYTNDPPRPVRGVGLPFDVDYEAIRRKGFDTAVRDHLDHHWSVLFRTKLLDWADEHEYRFIVYSRDEDPLDVPIHDALVAVCVGWKFHDVYKPSLRALCEQLSIPALQCTWDNGFPTIDLI